MPEPQPDYWLRLPRFDYLAPETVGEACRLLAEYAGRAKVMAGGTDLLVSMKQQKVAPAYIVNIKAIPGLDYIRYRQEDGLRIGALATLQSVAASPVIREKFGLLGAAVDKIGTPQVRNMGTIGGNISNGGPSQDSLPGLLVLGARLKLVGLERERTVPVDEFLVGPFQTALEPTELLTEVQIPAPPPGSAGCYRWLSKLNEVDETLVGVAVLLMTDAAGDVCREVRIGLGSVAPVPFRATKAEEVLRGRRMESETITLAAGAAAEAARPRSRAEYRRQMTRVLVERALADAWQQAKQSAV
jgi:CO/xanthine dehydrogenase FAD-binding subunit